MWLCRQLSSSTTLRVTTLWRHPRDQVEYSHKQQQRPCGNEECREKEEQKDEGLEHKCEIKKIPGSLSSRAVGKMGVVEQAPKFLVGFELRHLMGCRLDHILKVVVVDQG